MELIAFACFTMAAAFLQCEGLAANSSIFNSASHYWPLNRHFGIVDIRTNSTGSKHGNTSNIFFKGPRHGYLHTGGKAWIGLGNFTGSCLAEPARCNRPLTVFLWLKYAQNKNKRYLVGTSSHLTYSEGFTIFKESDKIANDTIVLRLNDGQREWTGSLNLRPNVWSHVAFTWERKSGLALFQNCRQMALVSEYTDVTAVRNNRSNVLKHFLTLSGAQNSYPNVGVKASYEDLTVFYRKMKSYEMSWICHHKLEAPKLNTTCHGSERWLSITWTPPPMTYNILTGYSAWQWSESSYKWSKLSLGSQKKFLNMTNLDPGTRYKFRVQNAFRFGSGRLSGIIECKTKTGVLNPPVNVSVEMMSSIGTLLTWIAPPVSSGGILGYKITYTSLDFDEKPSIVKVGPGTSFLLTELQKDTNYSIQVASYGDKRFLDSTPASTTVQTNYNDKTSVRETSLDVIGFNSVRGTWKKPPDKYKEFSYRAFVKWTSMDGTENMLEVCDANATFCVYHIAVKHKFYVMAYVVREIPLIRIVESPRDVTISSLSWSHMTLSWTSPFNETTVDFADRYRLIVKSTKDEIVIMTKRTFVRIDGLRQLTDYELNLEAWNRLGYGPVHDVRFRTPDHDECADNSHTCHTNAACTNTAGSYKCECKLGFIGNGRTCEEIPEGLGDEHFCPQENVAGIEWRRTMTQRQDMVLCPEGTVGMALRACSGSRASWDLPDLSDCVSKWMADIREQLNNPNVSVSLIANQLSSLTDVKSGKPLYSGDLKLLVDVIDLLSQRGPGTSNTNNSQDMSQTFVKAVVGTASNILADKHLQSWNFVPKEAHGLKASSLIDSLDVIALKMANGSNANATEMENIAITVSRLENLQKPEFALTISQQENGGQELANAVSFPASVLIGNSSAGSKPDYATFVSYKTLAALLTPRGLKSTAKTQQNEEPSVNSAVVSLNLRPLTKKTFKDPVVITLRHSVHSKGSNEASCVFLETDRNISWSRAGCNVNSSNETHTVCHCYHLTSFAVLMSVKQDISSITKGHQLALSLITYIGVSISVVALCLAFLTFYFFRFSKSGRTFIHKNLTIALIFAQLVFLFGISKTSNKLVCKGIAIALHYFFLVSFAWMALEGVMLYLMLVKVFHTKTSSSKTKKIFFSLGWGLPVVIVVTSGVIFHQGYGTPAYCWLSLDRGFIWSFVGPVLLVLAFNFIFLGMTFRVMTQSGPGTSKKRTNKIRRWSKACMLLTCILGLTWLFGVFYINRESLFMAYFFTIFNTLQGVFIFLFHCVGDEKVRLEYRRVLCCIDPDKRHLLTKPSYSMSNSKSESSSKSMKSQIDNFKAKNQTLSGSASSEDGSIESKRSTFVVHVSDGQVRVRGLASDEPSRRLLNNQQQSQTSSSFGQLSGQSRKSRRQSSVSRNSEASDSDQGNELSPLGGKN